MTVADDDWPVIGATGARFGSAARRRRRTRAERSGEAGPRHLADGENSPQRGHREPGSATRVPAAVDEVRAPASAVTAAPGDPDGIPAPDDPDGSAISFVRPFVRSGGRTRPAVQLEFETLVSAVADPPTARDDDDHRSVYVLCARPRSVAELAALTSMPIGVARVLVGDLVAAGAVRLHDTAGDAGPGRELLERVLAGIRAL